MIPLILLAIGIFLIIHNYKKINKVKESFEFTLNEEKENLNDYKLELGILRRDIGESLTELQQEIKNIKINMNMVNDIEKEYDNILDGNVDDFKINATEDIITKKQQNYKEESKKFIGYTNEQKECNGVVSKINFENKNILSKKEEKHKSREIAHEIDDLETLEGAEDSNKSNNKNQNVFNEVSKQHMISELIKKDFTDEEICKALSISKGEVLLVRNLFKN